MDRGPLLRKLKRSHPLSASGMRSIVSRPSLGYLAPVTGPLFQTPVQDRDWEGGGTSECPQCPAAVAQENNNINSGRKVAVAARKEREEKVFLVRSRCSADRIGRCLPSLPLQIFLWEQNLEQFHMDLFRFRCYLASLQGGELPNPKRLLAVASRPTKLAMGRLGIFSVSSFHALVNGLRSHFDSNIHL